MPEGDTLFRTATVLREVLQGKDVVAARGRADGAALARVVGSRVDRVDSHGKHLLIGFDNGLTLHTHMRMNGSWHRYRTAERWQRSPSRAVAVIEVPGAVAVCFDAPTVELIDTRALALHPSLRALGPDLLAPAPDLAGAAGRLRSASRAGRGVAEGLLDQTALAGLGNVYRSEVLFIERVDPFLLLAQLDPVSVGRLVATGARLLRANANSPARRTLPDALGAEPGAKRSVARRDDGRFWVYGRAGRPCRVCGTLIRSDMIGADLPRRLYWCPSCQGQELASSRSGD
jgi:endonuclease-8